MTVPRLLDHHRHDLEASGLSPETIAAAGIYSAPEPETREILGFGVGPGWVIPYPGTENGARPFCRVKPDTPPVWNGKPAKYLSPKGSRNRLYVPPILSGERVRDPGVPLYVTEGEKKALKAVQEGVYCVGLAGVDAWRTRADDGRSVPIADLDQITWRGRTVTIVFDSDLAWKPEVQRAEFALACELRSRGAVVQAVRIPQGPDGGKGPRKNNFPVFGLYCLGWIV